MTLDSMVGELRLAAQSLGARHEIAVEVDEVWHMSPTAFDAELVNLIERTADALGYSRQRIVSGAVHDSLHTARVAPTAMIFVPCAGGLSHNEAESATPEAITAGANVLLHAAMVTADD